MPVLKEYQLTGAKWLKDASFGAILGDQMGLGKSAEAIQACTDAGHKKAIVLCPAIGTLNWQREFELWADAPPELEIHSYAMLVRHAKLRKRLREWKADVLICDEAHYLKNKDSKRTQRVYGPGANGNGLCTHVGQVWLLTGTPALRDALDLWTHLHALWPGLLRHGGMILGRMEFMQRYCHWRMAEYEPQVTGLRRETLPELQLILDIVMLRRKVEQVAPELPPMHWANPYIVDAGTLTPELKRLEGGDEAAALKRVLNAAQDDVTHSLSTGVKPIELPTLRRLTAMAKAPHVGDLIADELASKQYEKIVVFATHTQAIKILDLKLRKYNPIKIQGGQTVAERQRCIDEFTDDPALQVAIVQQQAGNHLINLQAANQVAFLEQSWLHEENIQAAKRCHRIGQTRPVYVRTFGLRGSIDETLTRVLTRRAQSNHELLEE